MFTCLVIKYSKNRNFEFDNDNDNEEEDDGDDSEDKDNADYDRYDNANATANADADEALMDPTSRENPATAESVWPGNFLEGDPSEPPPVSLQPLPPPRPPTPFHLHPPAVVVLTGRSASPCCCSARPGDLRQSDGKVLCL